MPASVQTFNLVDTTPEQNPFVRFEYKWAPDLYYPVVQAGWYMKAVQIPRIFKINHIHVDLATTADVDNRIIYLYIVKLNKTGLEAYTLGKWKTGNIAASTTGDINISPFGVLDGATLSGGVPPAMVQLSGDIILQGNDYIICTIDSVHSGDIARMFIEARYLNNELGVKQP